MLISKLTALFTKACLTNSTTAVLVRSGMSPNAPSVLKSTSRFIICFHVFILIVDSVCICVELSEFHSVGMIYEDN